MRRSSAVRVSDLDALEAESRQVLEQVHGQIHDGRIGGRPWLHVVLDRAIARLRRKRAIEARRGARGASTRRR